MIKNQTFFVTGTDTGAGKTTISCGLLEKAKQQNLSTIAIKPVASGCEQTSEGLRNADALALSSAMTISLPYEQINPIALKTAVAPHIAAVKEGVTLSVTQIIDSCRHMLEHLADFSLIEGAGGWRVPLSHERTAYFSDIVKALHTPVILVIGARLGCINHALLTAEAIINDGITLGGWVVNQIDAEMSNFEENMQTLRSILPDNCIGCVPFMGNPSPEKVASYLSLENLHAYHSPHIRHSYQEGMEILH